MLRVLDQRRPCWVADQGVHMPQYAQERAAPGYGDIQTSPVVHETEFALSVRPIHAEEDGVELAALQSITTAAM